MEKRRRGRPTEKPGPFEGSNSERTAIVLSSYSEAREQREKHSFAVDFAVAEVERLRPSKAISRTGVNRILAQSRGKGSPQALQVSRGAVPENDAVFKVMRFMELARIAFNDPRLPPVPTKEQIRKATVYTVGVGKRKEYLRSNSRSS